MDHQEERAYVRGAISTGACALVHLVLKFLTEEDIRFKDLSHYLKLKRTMNREPYSKPWATKYQGRPSIGSCMYLCKELKPVSYEDFYEKYVRSGYEWAFKDSGDRKSTLRGRTYEELEDIAVRWKEDCPSSDYPLSTFYDAIILHAIIETFMGNKMEMDARCVLHENGFTTEDVTDDEDAKMGIDFKVCKDGELKYLMQVKPLRFFISTNRDTNNDRRNVYNKQKDGNSIYPDVPYKYLIYDTLDAQWIYNPNTNRCLFDYEDLVSINGSPIYGAAFFQQHKTDKLFRG